VNAALSLSLAYALVALVALRPLAGHYAWFFHGNDIYANTPEPNGEKWLGAYLLALLLVTAWPVVAVVVLVGRVGPKVGAERVADIEAREKRLREAEKELGLEPWPS
jgi:hypothetical protein